MRLQTGLPASLFYYFKKTLLISITTFLFITISFLKTEKAFAASWQRLDNFPITQVGALATVNDTIYAGTDQSLFEKSNENGFYKIENSTTTKVLSDPNFIVNDLAVENNVLYATFYNSSSFGESGVYKSVDGGTNWQLLMHFTTSPRTVAARGSLLLVGTHDALWRSEDGGKNWEKKVQLESFNLFNDIAVNETAAFATTNGGLYRSTDDGKTWQTITIPQPISYIAAHGQTLLAGGQHNGLIRSTDNGDTWQVIYDQTPHAESPFGPFVFSDGNTVFAGGYHKGESATTATVFESNDSGVSWQKIDDGITHSMSTTQDIKALTVAQGKVYMAMSQDGLFVRQIDEPTKQVKMPVILIPGIGGSEYEAKEAFTSTIHDCNNDLALPLKYDKAETVWVNEAKAALSRCDDYFDALKLKEDGQTEEYPQVGLKGTIYDRSYGKAVKFFEKNGYTLNKDLFVFPYDWRKDIRLTTPILDDKINDILKTSGATKVQIVAHSMGGLVAREYIRDPQRAAKVDTLVELGVPHLGATRALSSLLYGDCWGKSKIGLCVGVSNDETQDIFQNLTGGYDLLNTKEYFSKYSDLPPFRDDRDIDGNRITGVLNYEQTKDLLKNLGKNMQVFNFAESFHKDVDPSLTNTNGVKVYLIVGSGLPTLGQIREYTKTKFGFIKRNKRDMLSVNGDDTVPLLSASLNQSNNVFYTKLNHSDLVESDTSLSMTKNLLNGDSMLVAGVQTQPYKLNAKVVSTHSPVELHAYDEQGNHTGPLGDGQFEANIPGSSYETLGDASFITLPEEGTFKVVTHATAAEDFDLKLKDYKDDALTSETLYLDVPQTAQTSTSLVVDGQQHNLQLDENNDNQIDKEVPVTSILPADQAADLDAPTTTANSEGTKGEDNWFRSDVKLTLSSRDNQSGSGILKTEYSLDGWQTVHDYDAPITITSEGVTEVLFRSIDKAFNEESPQTIEVKIDKTPPELTVQFDPTKKSFVALGNDTNLRTITSNNTAYVAQDFAGNETKLGVNLINNLNDENSLDSSMNITDLSYNDQKITLSETSLKVNWKLNKQGEMKSLIQNYQIKKQEKIIARYNLEKERGTVIEKTKGEKTEKTQIDKLAIVQLNTSKGKLMLSF